MAHGPFNRRQFLTLLGASAGAVTLLRFEGQAEARPSLPSPEPQPEPTRCVELAGLAPGARLGRWTISAVHGIHCGAIPVVLVGAQGRFQLDVLRRDPQGAQGIGNSERLSVFLCNQGDGQTRTLEDHGLAAIALGRHLMRHEGALPVDSLLTFEQRREQHRGGMLVVT